MTVQVVSVSTLTDVVWLFAINASNRLIRRARFSHLLSNSVETTADFRGGSGSQPPAPICLLSLSASIAIPATGRPLQPQTLMLSLRSSSPSSAVSKSRPSHKGKLLVHNRLWHDVRLCGRVVNETPRFPQEVENSGGGRRLPLVSSVKVKSICWTSDRISC